MSRILADSQTIRTARPEGISQGETRTSNGLALSPTMAAMCADDLVRTLVFIRGTHAAIIGLRTRFPERPVRVLYAGCGPQATLAAPLMSVFSPAEAMFTLIDVHPESVALAKSMIAALGLASSVAAFETTDATSYRVCSDQPPDLILVETMQAGLEAEPQVAITRHLLQQCPNAILLPEEVRVELILVDPSREFNLEAPEQQETPFQPARVPIATAFALNRETIRSWENNRSNRLPPVLVKLPDSVNPRYQPMLFTTVRVYGSHVLKNYDSGLTCPRRPVIKGAFAAGDTVRFQYELGIRPGLRGEVVTGSTPESS